MQATRRQFLAASTGVMAGGMALMAAAQTPAKAPAGRRWKTGLGLNGFMSSGEDYKKTYPIWEVLDFATKAGFDGIELVEGWPMGGYPAPEEADRIQALKRMYDQYGLRVYTFQTGSEASYSADPAVRQNWLKDFESKIRLAKQLNCEFIGHWPGGGLAGNPDIDHAIDSLADAYRKAAQMCADNGLYFSFEIEPPFVFNKPEHLERILAAVDHPACRTNYDPSHFDVMWGSKGKPEEMLARIGVGHIGHVHLTDTDGTIFNGTSKHLPCGDGHCDIRASLKTLWDGGYAGWIMIDGWKIEDIYRAASQGIQAINSGQDAFAASGA